jgi:hypothetical protein
MSGLNQSEIIEMAKQAGFSSAVGKHIALDDDLERFAALIASAEREACAKIGDDHPSWSSRMYSATIRARNAT